MKFNELEEQFEQFAKARKLKTSPRSHFKGHDYITAKPYTISLHASDARLGKKAAIVMNLPKGTIANITGFASYDALAFFFQNSIVDIAATIKNRKKSAEIIWKR